MFGLRLRASLDRSRTREEMIAGLALRFVFAVCCCECCEDLQISGLGVWLQG